MLTEKYHLEGFPTKMKVRKKFVRLQCLAGALKFHRSF